jgi:hypothetical protein
VRAARVVFVAAVLAMALPFSVAPGHAQDQIAIHRMAAEQYEIPGLVEEAVAEWIKVLALSPQDAEARARVDALVKKQMPMWLPEEVERAAPFKCELLMWANQAPAGTKPNVGTPSLEGGASQAVALSRFLVTAVDFAAREGERWDELHETGFSHIDYGYVWSGNKRRYEARVVLHWEEPAQAALAHDALEATLVCYALAREQLGIDPTRPWGDPVDLWVTNKGQPGARAQGRSIYLYAAKAERAPGEWLRELAHEYGHVCMPGIDGFTSTDDAWADGHLAELLIAKWLAAAGAPEWLPWPAEQWEAEAAGERARLARLWSKEDAGKLIGQQPGTAGLPAGHVEGFSLRSRPTVLTGTDEKARDAFLGLALRVEEMKGPRFLGDVLSKCPRGTAAQFVKALGRMR